MTIVQSRPRRSADPYRDLDVIDERAPRFNQTVVALVCAIALISGWWPLASLMGVQLLVGLLFGRRWCLPCVLYFGIIQPRLGEGEIEDARPPRFANMLGASFLIAASACHLAGAHLLGWVLIGLVGVLASFAALTGICVGCTLYKVSARWRGITAGSTNLIDLSELGITTPGPVVVQFMHPLCTGCRQLESRLQGEGFEVANVDISRRRDLARKYHVSVVPSAFLVEGRDGRVEARLA